MDRNASNKIKFPFIQCLHTLSRSESAFDFWTLSLESETMHGTHCHGYTGVICCGASVYILFVIFMEVFIYIYIYIFTSGDCGTSSQGKRKACKNW